MRADHEAAQGHGHWKNVLRQTFDRVTRPSGYTFDDLRAITALTLIRLGDLDPLCPVEEGVAAYCGLTNGEICGVAPHPEQRTGRTDDDRLPRSQRPSLRLRCAISQCH
jgi:hypothetical protein